MLLRPAGSSVVAIVRASGSLAGNTIITREAGASACLAIAGAFVGALDPRVDVVSIDDFSNPGEVTRTSAL